MKAHVRPSAEIVAAIERGKQKAIEEKRKRDQEMANYIYASMVTANLEAESVILAAARRYFGLGEKRMREFLEFSKEVKKEYDEHRKDGVFGYMMQREFEDINIDIVSEMSENDNLDIAMEAYKGALAPQITEDEAEKLSYYLTGFKNYVAG